MRCPITMMIVLLNTLLVGAAILRAANSEEFLVQGSFRVREDFAAALNADHGWAGSLNENVPIIADQPFRLRVEVLWPNVGEASGFLGLQYRRNYGAWRDVGAHDFPNPSASVELDLNRFQLTASTDGADARSKKAEVRVVQDGQQRILVAEAGEESALLVYPQTTDLSEVELEGEMRLPESSTDGVSVVIGYSSAQTRYEVFLNSANRTVEVHCLHQGAAPKVVMQQPIDIEFDSWFPFAVEFEEGQMTIVIDTREYELSLEDSTLASDSQVGFRLPRRQSAEIRNLLLRGLPKTPPVSIVACPAFADQTPTADLLEGAKAEFCPGVGSSLSAFARFVAEGGRQSEVEWPLVVRRYADGPTTNETGDVFEFRMVASDGRQVDALQIPQLRLEVAAGHLGGTYVETPGRIGPWQASNGDLYFIMEPTETDNVFMVVKSTDGGVSWQEVDGGHRPSADDLEGVDALQIGDTIHILHQVTSATWYHTFHTSDHPTLADRWGIRDQLVGRVEARAQAAALVVRSDGSRVAFFVGEDQVHYSLGSSGGAWSKPQAMDPHVPPATAGPQAVLGANDDVHLAYYGLDGSLWHRHMEPNGKMSERQLIAEGVGTSRSEFGSMLPLSFLPATNTLVMIYGTADGQLWERRRQASGSLTAPTRVTHRRVVVNAVDSQQPGADVVLDGDNLYVLYIDSESGSIFSVRKRGEWEHDVLRIPAVNAQWVRGNVYTKPDGKRVYGFVYDAGSGGGAGMNRYAELPLD
ncbi:MAG: hypothetical protein NXI32_23705 [bacterium]|nr:hypothetical protein [bacterium]